MSLDSMLFYHAEQSRAINAENPAGERGRGGMAASELGIGRKGAPCILNIPQEASVTLADIEGSGMINHIWITLLDDPGRPDSLLEGIRLTMYWDGSAAPAVDSPLGSFFCCGFGQDCLVNSLPIAVNPRRGMNVFFHMPFRSHARIVIENHSGSVIPRLFYQIDYTIGNEFPEDVQYFHALYRKSFPVQAGSDHTLLDITGAGTYAGTYLSVRSFAPYCWCEGELKFYLDDDTDYPTICGTGTEDYFGGAWGFGVYHGRHTVDTTFCAPYMGYPYHAQLNVNNTIHERGLYRWHLEDPIYFHDRLRVTLQSMGKHDNLLFEREDEIATVAYWYQKKSFRRLL